MSFLSLSQLSSSLIITTFFLFSFFSFIMITKSKTCGEEQNPNDSSGCINLTMPEGTSSDYDLCCYIELQFIENDGSKPPSGLKYCDKYQSSVFLNNSPEQVLTDIATYWENETINDFNDFSVKGISFDCGTDNTKAGEALSSSNSTSEEFGFFGISLWLIFAVGGGIIFVIVMTIIICICCKKKKNGQEDLLKKMAKQRKEDMNDIKNKNEEGESVKVVPFKNKTQGRRKSLGINISDKNKRKSTIIKKNIISSKRKSAFIKTVGDNPLPKLEQGEINTTSKNPNNRRKSTIKEKKRKSLWKDNSNRILINNINVNNVE